MKRRKNVKTVYDQYKLKIDTFNQYMGSIQTVLTISVAISTGILIALFVELNTAQIFFNPQGCSKTELSNSLILSGIAFVQNIFCLLSIISQIKQCKNLYLKIREIEKELRLETLLPENWCKPSLRISVISSVNTCFVFFVIAILSLIRLF